MFDITEYLLIIIVACFITIIIIGSGVIGYVILLYFYYRKKGTIWTNWNQENVSHCPKCNSKVSWPGTMTENRLLDIKCPNCGIPILKEVK